MKTTRIYRKYRHNAVCVLRASLKALLITFAGCAHFAKPLTLEKQFTEELAAVCEEYRFPGATAAYVLPDGHAVGVAVGLADIERGAPMTPESRMLAASIGKMFVAVTTLSLADEGFLNLDDPIRKWLGKRPWFTRLPNHDTATLRQLLTHRSGIPNHVETDEFAETFRKNWQNVEIPFPPEQLISFVLDKPALFPAGQGWHYSDTGYILVGLIIETATGRTYYEELSNRLLDPLQLTLTTASDGIDLTGLATGYITPDNPFGLPHRTVASSGHMAWNPAVEWTGGGLISTPKDLVVWAKTLFEGDALDCDYLDELLSAAPIDDKSPSTRYGLGVGIHEEGMLGESYGHGGWIPGYCSSLRYYPEHRIAVALQINTDIGITDSTNQVMDAIEIRLARVVLDGLHDWHSAKEGCPSESPAVEE